MKVYITYFRYDRDENYSIYHIDLNKKNSIRHYKEEDLPSFLGYGPDDVSVLTLQEVEMSKSELTELIRLYGKNKDYDRELIDFMTPIFSENCYDPIYLDSGDTVWEVINFFIDSGLYDIDDYITTPPTDPDDLCQVVTDLLFDDDDLFNKVLRDFINSNY